MVFHDKKFTPLFWTQFFGAFNDNVMKNALVLLITFRGVQLMGLETSALVAAAGGIFILPFALFSTHAGQLADKFEKSRLARFTKVWELTIMVLASVGFYFNSWGILMFLLFLMGIQSTFFGPIKYSIVPHLVTSDRLTEANACIQMGTFVAILLGTIVGGAATQLESAPLFIVAVLLVVSLLGLIASAWIPSVRVGQPDLKFQVNPFPSLKSFWKIIREDTTIFNSVLGISWFWFFGAGVLSVLPVYCKDYLGVDQSVVTAFLAMFTIGIGLGSLLCSKLSFKQVETGLVPIGSFGMSLFLVGLFFIVPPWNIDPHMPLGLKEFFRYKEGWYLLIDFLLMSIFGGFYILPLNTLLQKRSHPESLSRVIATNNILNAASMVVSAVMVMIFYSLQFTHPQVFLVFAILNAVTAVYLYFTVPEFTLRLYSWVLCHLMYRLKVTGTGNIPQKGPAILTCNHVSFVDWLILSSASPRPVRFIMYYKFFEIPLLRHLMKQAQVIPIARAKEDPKVLEKAFDQIQESLKKGELICLFPEGQPTHDGKLSPFCPALVKILKTTPAPVLPVALMGMWGSLYSHKGKIKGPPFRFWRSIHVDMAPPIGPESFCLDQLETQTREMVGTNI